MNMAFDGIGDIDDGDEVHRNQDRSHCETYPANAYCTFAVTRTVPCFQAIFICHDCIQQGEGASGSKNCNEPSTSLCICQACADICHDGEDHEVEYIGMGPCYCDCDHVGECSILQQSQVVAERLLGPHSASATKTSVRERGMAALNDSGSPLQEAFDVPSLHSTENSTFLVAQAEELIRHSKETFWVDKTVAFTTDRPRSAFELLAWKIYKRHRKYYDSLFTDDQDGGAEWWVQVKRPSNLLGENGAIDLHYDKDEALSETFGLGSFPTLSTVTYLTESHPSVPFSPTLVFNHTYVQGEDDMIDSMLVSQPNLGKHLVFDGELLHGAPAHEDLRGLPSMSASPTPSESSEATGSSRILRVTFLVNIWPEKPTKIQPLPESIRRKLMDQPLAHLHSFETDACLMYKNDVPVITLEKDEDLPEHLRHRIELPFVSKGATWDDQLLPLSDKPSEDGKVTADGLEEGDDDHGGELVVVTFPPPPTNTSNNTLVVKFGPGLQAYLDYPHTGSNENLRDSTMKLPQETGYV